MRRSTSHTRALYLTLLLAPLHACANIHAHDDDEGLFRFVSRPEIRAPRWLVNITEEDLVSPGYWFTAPFEYLDQHERGNGWIGPHIYDGNGDLVWSGVHLTDNWDAIDFKRSNVRGQDLITYQVQHEGNGYIIDDTFEIKEKVDLGILGVDFNSHEFYFLDNGTRAISMTEGRALASPEQSLTIQWEQDCHCLFNGFKEWDTETWEPVFEWSSSDHVSLNESTFLDGGIERGCNNGWGWDYVHLNAVDKDQNGDYYVSARHADTIYKVSQDDGHIIWRLHGYHHQNSDFDSDVSFSRQHNVRFRGFNGTHEIITILDNAMGNDNQEPSHESSRGLMIALQTDVVPMTARLVSAIDHPRGHGSYAPRRGNYQLLDNENIFIGWSEQATHSEHTPDGRLIMEATLRTEWLGTYRSYKFPFVGRPSEPPVAVSAAYESKARNSTTTTVHVSWNGATEVDSWNLYKTTETGEPKVPIFWAEKTGFETAMAWDGYASFVYVEALDREGNVIGNTSIVETVAPPATAMSGALADELFWMQELHGSNDAWRMSPYPPSVRPRTNEGALLLFFSGIMCTVSALALFWVASLKGWLRSSSIHFHRLLRERYEALSERDREKGFMIAGDTKELRTSFHDGDS